MSLDKRRIRASFGRAVAGYDAVAALQRNVGTELISRLALVRLDPARIVDIGTGTGHCLRLLRQRYHKAPIGLDLALPMLQAARTEGPWWARPPVVCADAERLPFARAAVDLLVSNLALQWCDLDRAFAEFKRVLAPGGLLLFSTFGPETLREVRSAWATVDDRPHVHTFFDMHDIGDALMRAGLAEPVLDVDRWTVQYPAARAVLTDLKALGATNVQAGRFSGLTGKDRFRRFEQALEAGRKDGQIPVHYEVVYASAWQPREPGVPSGVHPIRWHRR